MSKRKKQQRQAKNDAPDLKRTLHLLRILEKWAKTPEARERNDLPCLSRMLEAVCIVRALPVDDWSYYELTRRFAEKVANEPGGPYFTASDVTNGITDYFDEAYDIELDRQAVSGSVSSHLKSGRERDEMEDGTVVEAWLEKCAEAKYRLLNPKATKTKKAIRAAGKTPASPKKSARNKST